MEGTYPLPEAQLDRFLMKILVKYPSREDLSTIVTRTTQKDDAALRQILNRGEILELRKVCRHVLVAPHVQSYAIDLVLATQPAVEPAHEMAKKYIRYGSSPRGAQALVECGQVLALMKGRLHLSIEDVQAVAHSVLRHRIILNFDAHAEGQTPETVLKNILSTVSVPPAAATRS
jgi:MoxR-like ATPase